MDARNDLVSGLGYSDKLHLEYSKKKEKMKEKVIIISKRESAN